MKAARLLGKFVYVVGFATLSLSVSLSNPTVLADDADTEDTQSLSEKAHELAQAEANSLKLKLGENQLQLDPESRLHWSNPISGQVYGDVYVWTSDGRPEVIASIFKWFSPHTHLTAEVQSLSESALVMSDAAGKEIWRPDAGLKMVPLNDAPPPQVRPLQRLRQMKQMAEQFTAEAFDRIDPKVKWSLRLQRSPIYRYKSDKRGIADGALFAFCQGDTNNPEVLLMLEARGEGKDLQWYYGLGRQNSIRFRVQRGSAVVWDVPQIAPPWSNVYRPEGSYFVIKKKDAP